MKKRLYVVAIIMTLILSFLAVNVKAADYGFTASMKPSSTTIEQGKEFTVNIKVSNINVGDNGINSVNGVFEYDADAFEDITADSFEGLNDWTVKYTASTGKLSFLRTNFVKESQDICQITLKAKSDITATKGVLELKDLVASNSEESITSTPTEVSLEIGLGSETSNSNSIKINANTNSNSNSENNTSNNISRNNTSNNSNRIGNNTYNTNNTVPENNVTNESEDEEMPDTGLDDSIVKAILLVALVAILGYIKFRSLDRK